MKRFFVLFLAVVTSVGVLAADFELRILSYPKEVPQGAPMWVTAEIRNVSGHAITVCNGGPNSFVYALKVRRADGRLRQGCPPPTLAKLAPYFGTKELPADWKDVRRQDLSCRYAANANQTEEPGELVVEFTLTSAGPCPKGNSQGGDEYHTWTGAISAPEVRIELMKPSGVDMQAYKAFTGFPLSNSEKLLTRFPTSTYAGYALAENTVAFSDQPFFWLDDPEGNILSYYRTPDGRIGVTKAHIEAEKATMATFAQLAGPFLETHPDFIYAPLIRRMYAMCLGLTGDIPGAMNQISILAKGQGKEADEAKAYLKKKASAKTGN